MDNAFTPGGPLEYDRSLSDGNRDQQGFADCAELGVLPFQVGMLGLVFGPLTRPALQLAAQSVDAFSGSYNPAFRWLHLKRDQLTVSRRRNLLVRAELGSMGIDLEGRDNEWIKQLLTAAMAALNGSNWLVELVRRNGTYRS